MPTPHSELRERITANVELGEALVLMLTRKAQGHLEKIARTQDEDVVEFSRCLVDLQAVQHQLGKERHRLAALER